MSGEEKTPRERMMEMRDFIVEQLTRETDRQLQQMREVIEGLVDTIQELGPEIELKDQLIILAKVIESKIAPSAIPFFAGVAIEMLAEVRRK